MDVDDEGGLGVGLKRFFSCFFCGLKCFFSCFFMVWSGCSRVFCVV